MWRLFETERLVQDQCEIFNDGVYPVCVSIEALEQKRSQFFLRRTSSTVVVKLSSNDWTHEVGFV